MSTGLLLLAVVVVTLMLVAGAVEPARRGRRRSSTRGRRTFYASRRPPSWHGPTPAQLLDQVAEPADLLRLKWWQFEHVVAEVMRRIGFEGVTVLNSRGADGGIDIRATWRGQAIVVQVKHLRRNEFARIDSVRAFAHRTVQVGAVAGYFVTTGNFGSTATREAAACRPPVHLLDGNDLWRWVTQARPRPVPVAAAQVPARAPDPAARVASQLARLVGLGCVVLALGACGIGAIANLAGEKGAPPVVDAAAATQARSAASSYWERNEKAWIAGDAAGLAELYSGPGLEIANADLAMKTGNHPDRYPRPFRSATIYMPDRHGSTKWFYAAIAYMAVNQDGASLNYSPPPVGVLFVRDGTAWKAYARDVALPGLPMTFSLRPPDWYPLALPQSSGPYIADADAIPEQLAGYEAALAAGQKPETVFPTTFNNYPEAALAVPVMQAQQATLKRSFEVVGDRFRYSASDGSQVVLFSIRRTVAASPARAGACLLQAPLGPRTVSDLVPPGSYAQLTAVQDSFVAVGVPRRSGDATVGRQLVTITGIGRDVAYQATKGSCR